MENPADHTSIEKQDGRPVLATELWFTASAKDLEALRLSMQERTSMTTVRLGDRSYGTTDSKGGYEEGKVIRVRFRTEAGEFETLEKEAVVDSVLKKRFGELSDQDLAHNQPGERDREGLRVALERFYERRLTDDETVTMIQISFSKREAP